MPPRAYTNPGHLFAERAGLPQRPDDLYGYVEDYAAFVLEEGGARSIPVDLDAVCERFGIEWSDGALPEGTDGFSDGHAGRILVNEDHAEVRRRFTRGHELVELLFTALVESPVPEDVWHFLGGAHKERLCNRGGAAILLPFGLFEAEVEAAGVSVAAGRDLACRFGASLIATLIALVERGPGLHALVGWRRALKPTEVRATGGGAQLGLGPGFEATPEPRMRVQWVRATRGADAPFIPRDKSVGDGSVIARAAAGETCGPCHEDLDLGPLKGRCLVEALAVTGGVGEALSLIHLHGDTCHQAPPALGVPAVPPRNGT